MERISERVTLPKNENNMLLKGETEQESMNILGITPLKSKQNVIHIN